MDFLDVLFRTRYTATNNAQQILQLVARKNFYRNFYRRNAIDHSIHPSNLKRKIQPSLLCCNIPDKVESRDDCSFFIQTGLKKVRQTCLSVSTSARFQMRKLPFDPVEKTRIVYIVHWIRSISTATSIFGALRRLFYCDKEKLLDSSFITNFLETKFSAKTFSYFSTSWASAKAIIYRCFNLLENFISFLPVFYLKWWYSYLIPFPRHTINNCTNETVSIKQAKMIQCIN